MNSITKIITAVLLTATCSSHLFAQSSSGTTIYLSDLSPQPSGDHWEYSNNAYKILDGANVTVKGATAAGTGNYRYIIIDAYATAELTLDNATITNTSVNYGQGAIMLNANAKLTLNLVGINYVTGPSQWPAIAVRADENAELTIQGIGRLTARGGGQAAGIGGSRNNGAGKITILDGMVEAYGGGGSGGAAGIGGGDGGNNDNSSIIISGGTVTAYGNDYNGTDGGAGIGGGRSGSGGTIKITGGTVNAYGGGHGAGIGGGGSRSGGSVTIAGGSVTATGGYYGAGIGGGYIGSGGIVTITGGTVTATRGPSGTDIGNGYGVSGGSVTITGGSVKRTNNSGPQPTSDGTTPVYLNTLKLGAAGNGVSITAGSIGGMLCSETPTAGEYGIKDVKTDADSKVYFYLLPAGNELVKLTANSNKEYGREYTRSSNNDNAETLLLPYDITLSKTGTYDFSAEYGYDEQAAFTVTVKNAGYNPTDVLDIALIGTDFMLSKTSILNIGVGSEDNFTVTPKSGLTSGTTYTATVTVSKNSNSDIKASFDISFTVNKKNITITGGITATKVYDSNAGFSATHIDISGATLDGNLDDTNLTLDESGATGSFGTANVQSGNITFTGFALSGTKAGNYTLATQQTVSASITPKLITVTGITVMPKDYDGNKTATVTGLTFPDLVSLETFTLDDDYTLTAAYDDANADNSIAVKATIELKAAGPTSKNYTLTNGMDYPLTGNITQKAINITGGTATKAYDGTTAAEVSALTFDVSLANSELFIDDDYIVTNATYAAAGVGTGITVTADVTLKSPSKADNYVLLNGAGYSLTTGVITPNTPPVAALAFTLRNTTYDGSAHPVTVTIAPGITGLGDILAVKYTGTAGTDYPASATAPAGAGTYTVTVDIAAGTNYAAITGLVIGSFTIAPATPTLATLAFTLRNVIYDDRPHPVTVTAATGVDGLGDITVLYNGSTTPPVYPGTYTVTANLAAGTNYAAVTGLLLGTFTISEPPTPVIRRLVTLRSAPGLTTDPLAGSYYINSGTNFTFRLTPDVPSPDGTPPQVQTNRAGAPDGSSGIRMTANADGSYTVVILGIRENIEITLSTPTDNASVADDALTLSTAPGTLVITNSRPDAATLRVYTPAGVLVRLTTVPPGTTRLSVPPGIYIVSDGGAFRRKAAVVR
jgi:hypothetical protein